MRILLSNDDGIHPRVSARCTTRCARPGTSRLDVVAPLTESRAWAVPSPCTILAPVPGARARPGGTAVAGTPVDCTWKLA